MSEGLKIVITLRDGKATVGIQSPGCDPVVSAVTGGLEEVLAQAPALVTRAREQWRVKPKYPRTTRVTALAPALAAPARPHPVPAKPAAATVTPKMF